MKSLVMKYKLICFLISASLLVACEKDPIDIKGNAISFNNSPARAAKVEAPNDNARMWAYYYNTDNSTTTTKMVYGTESAPELATLSNINTTEGTAGLTVNGNTKYWFVGTYNFFSIYSDDFKNGNLSDATLNTSTHTLTFNYDITNQKELRYATALNEDGGDSITSDGASNRTAPVELNYKHLLSKIKFKGFSSVAGKEVKLIDITIGNLPKTATYSIAPASTPIVTCNTHNTEHLGLTYKGSTTLEAPEGVFKDEAGNIVTAPTEGFKYTSLTSEGVLTLDNGLVFPMENPNTVTFTVRYLSADGKTIKTKSSTLPSTQQWESGNSYIYTFYIQPSGPIIFGTYEIRDWEDGGSANISQWDDIK